MIQSWTQRPVEEANLFNPAFLCALSYEFVKAYEKEKAEGASLMIIIIALSICLHTKSRERLPGTTISFFYGWLQQNEDLLVGFPERAKNLGPYIKQAIMFGMKMKKLKMGNGHCVLLAAGKATFPKTFLAETNDETKNIIESCKFLARWLAKSGTENSIAAAFGVKP
jgi:hypothetical protein